MVYQRDNQVNPMKSTLFNGLTFIKKYGRIKTTN